jgi:multicomponent K+:H+ antiporter subunit G
MSALAEFLVAAAVVTGGLFLLLGAVGLARFPDFYTRLHAPTKASTLGVGGMLIAAIVDAFARGEPSVRELLVALFIFVGAPVSAALLATAAFHVKLRSVAPLPQGVTDTALDAGRRAPERDAR